MHNQVSTIAPDQIVPVNQTFRAARDNDRPALVIVEEDGRETRSSYAADQQLPAGYHKYGFRRPEMP